MRVWEIKNAFIQLQKLFDSAESIEDDIERLALQGRIMDEWEKGEDALANKLEAMAAMLKNMGHYAEACKAEKDRFAHKQKVTENQIQFIKERMILPALKAAKTEKIDAGMHKISVRHSTACDINDMAALPSEYKKEEIRVSADKMSILKKLKAGELVPGAVLLENESVQIK